MHNGIFRLRNARLLFVFMVTASTCQFHDDFPENVTPKYFPDIATFNVYS